MNVLRAGLENSSGKLIIVNLEMEAKWIVYRGQRRCPVWITLPPAMNLGQGFYGGVNRFSGFITKGYTHFGIRTAGRNPNRAMLIASGPRVPDKDVTWDDLCTGTGPYCDGTAADPVKRIPFILRALLLWFEPP